MNTDYLQNLLYLEEKYIMDYNSRDVSKFQAAYCLWYSLP